MGRHYKTEDDERRGFFCETVNDLKLYAPIGRRANELLSCRRRGTSGHVKNLLAETLGFLRDTMGIRVDLRDGEPVDWLNVHEFHLVIPDEDAKPPCSPVIDALVQLAEGIRRVGTLRRGVSVVVEHEESNWATECPDHGGNCVCFFVKYGYERDTEVEGGSGGRVGCRVL